MSEKLKPCPFCGSSLIKIEPLIDKDYLGKKYYIKCSLCDATSGFYKKRRDAVQAWNYRAYEQKQPELKPCPFCGKIPQLIDAGTYYYVNCFNELCKISPCTQEHATPEDAINEWNSRPEKITMNGELKSCPMCGSEAELIDFSGCSYSVDCSNSYKCLTIEKENYSTKQEAIDAWNTLAEVKE